MPEITVIPPGGTVALDPTGSAFAHGFGIFETMRYADGVLFAWQDHWARLLRSAAAWGLPSPTEASVLDGLRQLVREQPRSEATLKLSLVAEGPSRSRLYIYIRPPLTTARGRLRLRFEADAPLFSRGLLAGHKTHNYMESIHLLHKSRADGFDDCLRASDDGYVAETAVANVIYRLGGELRTPHASTGVLPGVTRAALLRAADLALKESRDRPEALARADAVFLCNASVGVAAVDSIAGFPGQAVVNYPPTPDLLTALRAAHARESRQTAVQLM